MVLACRSELGERRRCWVTVSSLVVGAIQQVALLHLQLLCAHHVRVDGGVPRPVELPQVNLRRGVETEGTCSEIVYMKLHAGSLMTVLTECKLEIRMLVQG